MKKALMALAATTIGLGAVNAWAIDNRVLPGLTCQYLSGAATSYDSSGRIQNTSTSSFSYVMCPLVRDNVGGQPSWIEAFLVEANQSYRYSGWCQFAFSNPGTGAAAWGPASFTTQWGSVPNLLQIPVQGTWGWGAEYLECALPPAAGPGANTALLSISDSE